MYNLETNKLLLESITMGGDRLGVIAWKKLGLGDATERLNPENREMGGQAAFECQDLGMTDPPMTGP